MKNPKTPPTERDQKTLDQQLLDDLAAGRTHCSVNGEFSRARCASRGKEVGEISACDQ